MYKNFGTDHFTDFEHLIQFLVSDISSAGHLAGYWAITTINSRQLNRMYTNNEGLCGYFTENSGNINVKIRDYELNNVDTYVGSFDTIYYMTIERNGSTLTGKIYSDSNRTNLLDTLTITCGTTAYEVAMGCFARGTQSYTTSYYTENLDLQEAGPETHTPSDTAKASDSIIPAVDHPFSDTAKATDTISYLIKHSISDLAKASDSLTPKVSHSISDIAKAQDIIFPDKLTLTDVAKANDSVQYSYETIIETPTENCEIWR